jgi:hypothetical protein
VKDNSVVTRRHIPYKAPHTFLKKAVRGFDIFRARVNETRDFEALERFRDAFLWLLVKNVKYGVPAN